MLGLGLGLEVKHKQGLHFELWVMGKRKGRGYK